MQLFWCANSDGSRRWPLPASRPSLHVSNCENYLFARAILDNANHTRNETKRIIRFRAQHYYYSTGIEFFPAYLVWHESVNFDECFVGSGSEQNVIRKKSHIPDSAQKTVEYPTSYTVRHPPQAPTRLTDLKKKIKCFFLVRKCEIENEPIE